MKALLIAGLTLLSFNTFAAATYVNIHSPKGTDRKYDPLGGAYSNVPIGKYRCTITKAKTYFGGGLFTNHFKLECENPKDKLNNVVLNGSCMIGSPHNLFYKYIKAGHNGTFNFTTLEFNVITYVCRG